MYEGKAGLLLSTGTRFLTLLLDAWPNRFALDLTSLLAKAASAAPAHLCTDLVYFECLGCDVSRRDELSRR